MTERKKLMPESFYSLDTQMSLDKIKRAKETDDFLVVKVVSWDYKLKYLRVDLGNSITGIIPLSEFTIYPVERCGRLAPSVYNFISKTVCACVIDISSDNIILSRRRNMLKAFEHLCSMSDEIIPCKITRIESYGIFTDIFHGLSGLIYIADIASTKISNPKDIGFEVGQFIDSKIISINNSNYHISLSHKESFNDIYEIYNVGDIISGTVLSPIDETASGYFVHIHPLFGAIMDWSCEDKIPYGTKVMVAVKSFRKGDNKKVKLTFLAFT